VGGERIQVELADRHHQSPEERREYDVQLDVKMPGTS